MVALRGCSHEHTFAVRVTRKNADESVAILNDKEASNKSETIACWHRNDPYSYIPFACKHEIRTWILEPPITGAEVFAQPSGLLLPIRNTNVVTYVTVWYAHQFCTPLKKIRLALYLIKHIRGF